MELKGTKTEQNLWEAFAGESQARNKYTFFASVAKKEGYEQLAAIFEETAANEKEHAKMWFKALNGGSIPDTMTCLEMAAGGEHDEWTEMYPRMAKEAKEAGADGILLMPPHMWLRFGMNPNAPFEYVKDVAEGADIDIIIHLYPATSKAFYPVETLIKVSNEKNQVK